MENHQIAWKTTNVHVNDVVTGLSYALAGFLVSTLFGVSPGHSSNSVANVFLSRCIHVNPFIVLGNKTMLLYTRMCNQAEDNYYTLANYFLASIYSGTTVIQTNIAPLK